MTVVKKKAVKKAAPKKAVAKKKVAVKKKAKEPPQVNIPEDTFKAPDVEKYEDGFVMTMIIAAAAAAVAFTAWIVNT
jgi:hypothetical protein